MVRQCCICRVEYGALDNVSFHRIPSNEELKQKWLAVIDRKISKNSSVCSQHFNDEDFVFKIVGNDIQRYLKPTAVPFLSKVATKILISKSDTLPLGNSNAFNQVELRTSQIPVVNSYEEVCAKSVNDVTDEDKNNSSISYETDILNVEMDQDDTQPAIIVKDKNLKRSLNEPHNGREKINRMARYIGDLRREDFTSDISWNIVKKYREETKQKHKILNQKVLRLSKRVERLQSIVNHVQQNQHVFSNNSKLQDNTNIKTCEKNSNNSKSETFFNYILDHDYI